MPAICCYFYSLLLIVPLLLIYPIFAQCSLTAAWDAKAVNSFWHLSGQRRRLHCTHTHSTHTHMHSYTHASINTHIHTLTHTHLLTLTHTRIRLYNVQLHGKILIRRWNNDVNLFWCCLSLSLLLPAVVVVVVVFHKHCRHVIAASIAVVVVVAKWGRVRVDFCTLHFKYEHIFVQCNEAKRKEPKRGTTRSSGCSVSYSYSASCNKNHKQRAANTGNMLLLSLEQELNIFISHKVEGEREERRLKKEGRREWR